ncbi:MAG: PTS sugar transporter subunit IIA [Wenzhouxiangellaceae bacterium]
MTRILVIAHAGVGEAMYEVLRSILGAAPPLAVIPVAPGDDADLVLETIGHEVRGLCATLPPLVLTDLPGATPDNLARSAVRRLCPNAPVVTGLNLPMLVRTVNHADQPAEQLARLAEDGGHRAIFVEHAT